MRSTTPQSANSLAKQIGKFQGVSFQIADMITEIDAADLLTLAAADRLDQRLACQPRNRQCKALRHRNAGPGHRCRDCKSTAAWA